MNLELCKHKHVRHSRGEFWGSIKASVRAAVLIRWVEERNPELLHSEQDIATFVGTTQMVNRLRTQGLCGDSMEGNYVDQSPQKHASLGRGIEED